MCLQTNRKLMPIYTTEQRSPATVSPSPEKMITSFTSSTPVLTQERRHASKKRVRFSHAEVVATVIDRCDLPIEDHQNMYYFAHELDSFKNEVRASCEKIRNHQISNGNNTAACTLYNTSKVSMRGLEQRICKNRQRNKALALWGTLKAQQRNNNPEFISMVARKCSYTATQLAHMEAIRDYCEVYNPEQISAVTAQIESFAAQSFPIKLKRKSPDSAPTNGRCETDTNGRNVRIRIT